jgi:hypothetical protein
MATLINTLENTNINDLLRAVNSTKEYLYFNISVFNVGVSIFIQCTDTFKQPSARSWNGYDFIIENDSTTNYYILESLKAILNDMTIVKTDRQIERIKLILNK